MKTKLLMMAMGIALTTQTLFAQVPSYVPTNGLMAYYPFNGNANDASNNGNNGTLVGSPNFTIDRFGNQGSSFQGGTTYITCPSTVFQFTENSNFSVSIWFIKSTINGNGRLISTENPEGNFRIAMNNSVDLYIRFGSDFLNFNINDNNWHHLVYTYQNRNEKIYIDNYLASVNYNNSTEVLNYGSPFTIGAKAASAYDRWIGKIDDIGIWNRVLAEQEITNLYNANQCITNITVTDTLIINIGQLSFNDPVAWANNITIAPNPASSEININFNNISNLTGGSINIINSLGQSVATTPITATGTQTTMQLSVWGGTGLYFVQVINSQGQIVDIKKIILQ